MLKRAMSFFSLAALLACSIPASSPAAEYQRDGMLIGNQALRLVKADESLLEIARQYDLGVDAIAAANPGVDPFLPGRGRRIFLPTEWILPDVPIRKGIVVNIAEMRLYVFSRGRSQSVTTFPIGIGDQGKETPVGNFTITEKIMNPAWYVPASIRKENPDLPAVVPPGPDNPMGSHALRLSLRTVLIHGTNRPWSIGTRGSHGCMRMYEEDIVQLFGMVGPRTSVTIVNQPVKAALRGKRVYMEVHDYGDGLDLYPEAVKALDAKKLGDRVDPGKMRAAIRERTGLLIDISK